MRSIASAFLSTLALLCSTSAQAVETDLSWDWEQSHRFYMAVEVHLPVKMWFNAERNTEVRAVAYQIRSIIDCEPGRRELKKVFEISCEIEDIALVAAAHPGDSGLMLPVLQEFDAALTGATLQLQVGENGRLRNVDLEDVRRANRRLSEQAENLRLILIRMVAGLDLHLPRPRTTEGDAWVQYRDVVLDSPSGTGTAGGIEIVHLATSRADGLLDIQTQGRAVIMPLDIEGNFYDTQYEAQAVFDPDRGLIYRNWTTAGTPTASSQIALGARGIDYLQTGELRQLRPGELHDIGETRESNPPDVTQTALQNWISLGAVQR